MKSYSELTKQKETGEDISGKIERNTGNETMQYLVKHCKDDLEICRGELTQKWVGILSRKTNTYSTRDESTNSTYEYFWWDLPFIKFLSFVAHLFSSMKF